MAEAKRACVQILDHNMIKALTFNAQDVRYNVYAYNHAQTPGKDDFTSLTRHLQKPPTTLDAVLRFAMHKAYTHGVVTVDAVIPLPNSTAREAVTIAEFKA